MSRPHCSLVMASYNRAHLLSLSIEGYNRLRFPLDRLEVVVIDDGSTDDTSEIVNHFDPRIDLKYIRLRKTSGLWRDCAAVINVGIRAAKGSVVLPTHPEILPGADAIQAVCDLCSDRNWVSCKGYYLSPEDQENLDLVDWREQGPKAFKNLPNFYAPRPGNQDYIPAAIESVGVVPGAHQTWESWIFAGARRKLWSQLGGFIVGDAWGSCDLLMLNRRRQLGIDTVTPVGEDEIVCHFNHDAKVGDFIPTDRDMAKAFAGAPFLHREQCGYPAVDELWGPIP